MTSLNNLERFLILLIRDHLSIDQVDSPEFLWSLLGHEEQIIARAYSELLWKLELYNDYYAIA